MNSKRSVVKKFGGTSVGSIERIRSVAALCAEYHAAHPEEALVVVASAMSGETNRLLALARSCVKKPAPRELDALLATGEQQSCALLAMALCELGQPAVSLSASQVGLTTDASHLEARVEAVDASRIFSVIDRGVIPVVAGFQGVSNEGNVTTLGRGGSDITAVALAAALRADACYIYTDVAGVFSADPRVVKGAVLRSEISYEEMLELAGLGAKVLHPRCVEFAYRYRIPLVTLSSFAPESGRTWIVETEKLMEQPVVSGVTARVDEAKLTIYALPNHTRGLGLLFGHLAEAGIAVDMITQSGVDGQRATVSFLVSDQQSEHALEIAQRLVTQLQHQGAGLDRDIARVSLVGVGMRTSLDFVSRTLEVLDRCGVSIDALVSSDIRISCVIARKYSEMAVRALHRAFVESEDQKHALSA